MQAADRHKKERQLDQSENFEERIEESGGWLFLKEEMDWVGTRVACEKGEGGGVERTTNLGKFRESPSKAQIKFYHQAFKYTDIG